jgi:transcriptional regulator with XRE-family HTH domain
MNSPLLSLPNTLKQARQARRLSQLELSMRVGVSQRHLSFVESGRANPSRQLLMAWLQELDAPLAVRNAAMLQAGYAPAYGAVPLTDPAMAQADRAICALLKSHEPMPAFVIDAHWNLLRLNQAAKWLAATVMPWTAALLEGSQDSTADNTSNGMPLNMLDLLVHPQGFACAMLNLNEVGPVLLSHLRDEASLLPAIAPKVDAFANFLRQHASAHEASMKAASIATRFTTPLLNTRFATPHGALSFFSMFTTFGTPQDITLASLRVEHLFAADEATSAVMQRQRQA